MHVQYADVSKAKQSSLSLRYPCRCPETENGIKRRHARENYNLPSWNCNECRLSRCGHSWRFDGGLLLKFCPGLNLIRAVVMGASFFFFWEKKSAIACVHVSFGCLDPKPTSKQRKSSLSLAPVVFPCSSCRLPSTTTLHNQSMALRTGYSN